MKVVSAFLAALAFGAVATVGAAQEGGGGRRAVVGPVQSDQFRTQYIQLGNQTEGLLYEPTGAVKSTALIFIHPNRNTFTAPVGPQMASRGYRVLMINYRGDDDFREANQDEYLPSISTGVTYLRTLPGVSKVVLSGHSGGGHLVTLYGNVAEHGQSACADAAKIYPCQTKGLDTLAKLDGVIILDSTLGAFHSMSSVDPAFNGKGARIASVDMFAPANGYDAAGKKAK
jgi:hypothetical protein